LGCPLASQGRRQSCPARSEARPTPEACPPSPTGSSRSEGRYSVATASQPWGIGHVASRRRRGCTSAGLRSATQGPPGARTSNRRSSCRSTPPTARRRRTLPAGETSSKRSPSASIRRGRSALRDGRPRPRSRLGAPVVARSAAAFKRRPTVQRPVVLGGGCRRAAADAVVHAQGSLVHGGQTSPLRCRPNLLLRELAERLGRRPQVGNQEIVAVSGGDVDVAGMAGPILCVCRHRTRHRVIVSRGRVLHLGASRVSRNLPSAVSLSHRSTITSSSSSVSAATCSIRPSGASASPRMPIVSFTRS
jgi:hypothetical protein